jgi:AraC-like DNA-binding protein
MRSSIELSAPVPGVLLGSRPSAPGTIRLATGHAPEDERPLLLREFFERLGVRYDAERVGNDPIEIDLTLQGLPGLQLLTGKLQGARYTRHRKSNDPTEDVGLIVNPGGPHFLAQGGREIVLGAGEATLTALTETLQTAHAAPAGLLVLRFPRPQLAPRLAGAQDCFMRRIPRDNAALGLLIDYVNIAQDKQPHANGDLQRLVVSHLYDLAAVAIGATRDATEMAQGRGLRAARLYAIKRDIARNLDQPDLSVAALAGRHGCTPRFIQRLFECEGTSFTDYVLAERLACAHRLLTDPRRNDEKITTIALDVGFSDVSYFNRAFRRRYGDTPSGIRVFARRAAMNANSCDPQLN